MWAAVIRSASWSFGRKVILTTVFDCSIPSISMKCIPNRIFEFARVLCSPTRIFLRYNCLRGHAIINSSCPQKGDSNDISLSFLCCKKERKSSSFLIGTPIYYLLQEIRLLNQPRCWLSRFQCCTDSSPSSKLLRTSRHPCPEGIFLLPPSAFCAFF
jgi:hypothetical protein